MDNAEIQIVLQKMGERVPPSSNLILIGGGALSLLGSPRQTMDVDFIGDDVHPIPLHLTILQVARELRVHAEPVPLDRFIPMPKGSQERSIRIGQYGNLEVHVADPYSIALSKLDRGFETDIEDILFLLRKDLVTLAELERIMHEALPQAHNFDFHPDILGHLQELKDRLK